MENLGIIGTKVEESLQKALSPTHLDVIDDSLSHAGHAGNPGGDAETHFHVNITSAAFDGENRLKRQRLVNAALGDLMQEIHAFSMTCKGSVD